jgi:hypothetical protein
VPKIAESHFLFLDSRRPEMTAILIHVKLLESTSTFWVLLSSSSFLKNLAVAVIFREWSDLGCTVEVNPKRMCQSI